MPENVAENQVIEKTITVEKTVQYDDARALMDHFESKGYVNKSGKMKDTMKNALLNGTLDLPQKFEAARERFESIIKRADRTVPIRDASRDVIVRLNKQVRYSTEFDEIWNKMKHKTVYRVKIDTKEIVSKCVKELMDMPPIPKMRLFSRTAELDIAKSGVSHTERETRTRDIKNDYALLPNILTLVGEQALIKRSDILEIIEKSGRYADFLGNPQTFIEQIAQIINDNCHQLDIDGISYKKIDDTGYFAQEIFNSTELMANLDKNAVSVSKSVYDYVVYDSRTVEKPFAVALVFTDFDELEVKWFDYVNWYNNVRIHGSLGYLTPNEYL